MLNNLQLKLLLEYINNHAYCFSFKLFNYRNNLNFSGVNRYFTETFLWVFSTYGGTKKWNIKNRKIVYADQVELNFVTDFKVLIKH